jgi:hypothetical protein
MGEDLKFIETAIYRASIFYPAIAYPYIPTPTRSGYALSGIDPNTLTSVVKSSSP